MERVVMRFGTDKTVTADEIVEDLDFGNLTPLRVDPTFKAGTNDVGIFDTRTSGRITLTRIEAPEDCPTDSPFILRWEYDASKSETAASPDFGGFVQSIPGTTERTFIQRVIMKVPTNRYATPIGYSTGAGGSIGFYPGYNNGTGTGEWKEYLTQVKYGTGTTSTTGHIYFRGGDNTKFTKFTVDIALVTYYEITNYGGVFSPNKIMSFSEERIMLPQVYEYPEELSGGRNLLLTSEKERRANKTILMIPFDYSRMVGEGLFTISFDAKINSGDSGKFDFYFRSNTSVGGVSPTKTANQDWERFSHTWELTRTQIETILTISFRTSATYGSDILIRNIKVEKGNKATDWTPAPEDLGLSYPPEITNFTPSFSSNFTLLPEISEGGQN